MVGLHVLKSDLLVGACEIAKIPPPQASRNSVFRNGIHKRRAVQPADQPMPQAGGIEDGGARCSGEKKKRRPCQESKCKMGT